MNWLTWIANLGAAQGIILALAIVTIPYGNRVANRFLAAFLLAESLRLLSLSYYYSGLRLLPGAPIYMMHFLSLTFGPLLYLYVHALVDKGFRFKAVYLWHFAPLLIALLLSVPRFFIAGLFFGEYDSYSALPPELKSKVSLITLPVYISLGAYSAFALRHIRRHQISIRSEFSDLEHISLRWLKWLLSLCLISAVFAGTLELLQALSLLDLGPRVVASTLTSVAIIYYIGLMGLRQPLIFDLDSNPEAAPVVDDMAPVSVATDSDGGKYQKSGLRQEEVERLWAKLSGVMQEEKPYIEAGLKLGDLASRVGSRPDYLSQVINTMARMNFYEFVNKFRVEEACRMLEADSQGRHTIADIAQEAGFSSINIFNRHFKRLQNTTPSAYRKQFAA